MQEDNSNSNDEKPNANKSQACYDVIRYVQNNDITALRQWIINGGDEDAGWSALHEAASRRDRKECLKLLLEYSDNVLDPESQSLWRETALSVACDSNREENVLLLLQKGYDPNTMSLRAIAEPLLYVAIENGNGNIVKHLLHYGADINYQNLGQYTALHVAVSNNNVEIGRILLDNNADVRLRDVHGRLPTHLASECDGADFLRLMLDADPSIIDVKDGMRYTALHYSIIGGNIDRIRCLCEKGAKMTGREFEYIPKETSNTSKVEMVKLLVELSRNQIKSLDPDDDEDDGEWLNSITCDIIDLHSVECLSLFLESGLPKHFLQTPRFSSNDADGWYEFLLLTPLAYLLNLNRPHLSDEIIEAMMRLLLDHDIIFADEYFRKSPLGRFDDVIFVNIQADRLRFYHQILSDKGITVDYAVQCCCNLENLLVDQVNRCFPHYYLSLYAYSFSYVEVELETLKFLIRNSSLLEPSLLSEEIIDDLADEWYDDDEYEMKPTWDNSRYSMYNYLTDLEPAYHLRGKRGKNQKYLDLLEELSPVADEFAKSTLKQRCRAAIRKSLRGKNANEDLLNFQRKLDELSTPLPISLKNYLLFRD